MGDGFGFLFLLDQEEDPVKCGYVDEEHGDHTDGVEDGVPADEVIEDVVGGSVALHEEHVVGAHGDIAKVGGDTEGAQYGKGDPDVPLLHAGQPRQTDVQGGKARNAVGHARGHVVQGQNRVCVIVLPRPNGAQNGPQKTEYENEIQSGLPQPSLGKGGQGDGDELNTAQKQGKVVLPGGGIVAPIEHDRDLEDLHGIHEDGGDHKGEILLPLTSAAVAQTQPNGQGEHGKDQAGDEDQVLGGEIPFRLTGIAADAEKFFHKVTPFCGGESCFAGLVFRDLTKYNKLIIT